MRAESFGAVALQYDRFRPEYARALMDDLAAVGPASTLDVGCGTGRVAVALTQRGLSVLGVEPDARMVALAKAQGVDVEIATFEAWKAHGREFDLVTFGNAWHWVAPIVGLPKLYQIVRPHGVVALFWVVDTLDEAMAAAFEDTYRRCAPGLRVFGAPAPPVDFHPLTGLDTSFKVETMTYPIERTLTADRWVGLIATVSDHLQLEPQRLADLQAALCEIIENLGGSVTTQCPTRLWLARRR